MKLEQREKELKDLLKGMKFHKQMIEEFDVSAISKTLDAEYMNEQKYPKCKKLIKEIFKRRK